MSVYTDWAHEKALLQTTIWMDKLPSTPEEMYQYAMFMEFIKDERNAFLWFERAAKESFGAAYYKYAEALFFGKGCHVNQKISEQYFKLAIEWLSAAPKTMDIYYRLAMCYRYGYGIAKDEEKAFELFTIASDNCGKALYEIALYYKDGLSVVKKNEKIARFFLRKSYDLFTEEAIFTDFDMRKDEVKPYEFQREIKEAFSFKLGQLMRMSEVAPSKDTYLRLANWYKKGYPFDTKEGFMRYQRLADEYEKKAADTVEEYIEGNLTVFQKEDNHFLQKGE